MNSIMRRARGGAVPTPAQPGPATEPPPRLGTGLSVGLALLSGCLWFLAAPPFDLFGLGWMALVPLLLAIERAPTPGRAALLGWCAGFVAMAGAFYWLIDVLRRFASFPLVAAIAVCGLFCAYQGLVFTVAAWAVRRIRAHRSVPLAVLCPVVFVAAERLLPEVFPCGLWISQAWHPLVLQIAELTGPLGVSALLLMVNGALYELLARRRAALAPASAAALGLALVLAGGALRMREVDAAVARAPRLVVGLVQPNAAYPSSSRIARAEAERMVAALDEQTARLVRAGAELVVWSEGSYPYRLSRDLAADRPLGRAGAVRPADHAAIIIGASTAEPGTREAFNSALLVDADGRAAGRYDKVRLLAFGEYVPAIEAFPWLRALLPAGAGRFAAGAGPVALPLRAPDGSTWQIGPIICYEDILPGYLRRVGALHPDLLVNLTSDGWFGAAAEPWQHLALSVFASIELRVAMVRAVNSGVSAAIDPNGRVIARSYADDPYRDPRPADGIIATVPRLSGGRTVFGVVGNLFGNLCVVAAVLLLALTVRRRSGRAPAPRGA